MSDDDLRRAAKALIEIGRKRASGFILILDELTIVETIRAALAEPAKQEETKR